MSIGKYVLPNPENEKQEELYGVLDDFMRDSRNNVSSNEVYFGDPQNNGSRRIKKDGNDLLFQEKESGSWTTQMTLKDSGDLDFAQDKGIKQNIGCSVYLSAAQSLADATYEKIQFDLENYDWGNDFNSSTYEFTAPVDGYYLVYANIRFGNMGSADDARVKIEKNGNHLTPKAFGLLQGGADNLNAVNVRRTVECNAGDIIHIEGYLDSSGVMEIVSDSSYAEIKLESVK